MSVIQRIALALVIIGAINWGLIGFFNFDLVASIFGGQQSMFSRVIYSLVGLSGLISLSIFFDRVGEAEESRAIKRDNLNYGTEFSEEFDFRDRDKKDRKK